jgi:hypothetical protein
MLFINFKNKDWMKIIYKGETKKVSDIKDYNLLIQRLA